MKDLLNKFEALVKAFDNMTATELTEMKNIINNKPEITIMDNLTIYEIDKRIKNV
jgi:hypothetical protein